MASGITLLLGLVLLGVGLLLAFFGRAMWESMMAIIGGFIGWFLAYFFATYIMGWEWWMAIIVGFVGGMLGSWIFGALVEVALALIVAILAGGLVYILGGAAWVIPAIIIFVIVFALSYYFMDDLIAIVTALIGGILSSVAIFVLMIDESAGLGAGEGLTGMPDPTWAILGGIAIFILGALVQTFFLKDSDRNFH